MDLSKKQTKLLDFATKMHGNQKRKYTGEPYVFHCLEVADFVSKYEKGCIEIALCHDLFEDTECDFNMLYKNLLDIGYSGKSSYEICTNVKELTDVFTHDDYPHLNRKKRKSNEAKRLSNISYKSQSVKYADLISNTLSITLNDIKFSKVYLPEKEEILQLMNGGNKELFNRCNEVLNECKKELKLDL